MQRIEKPELTWIEIDDVIEIAVQRFEKVIRQAQAADMKPSFPEPTLAIARAAITRRPPEAGGEIDNAVALTKTIQNAVGLFHQDVLGSVDGWESTGAASGVIDLRGTGMVLGEMKPIIAEVKMRHNTIKAADESKTWDSLKQAAALERNGTVAYIFQIVPKSKVPYDRQWKVSNREPNNSVRAADGVTAYHLVTGRAAALPELLHAMPFVMQQTIDRVLGKGDQVAVDFMNSRPTIDLLIASSLPSRSALQ